MRTTRLALVAALLLIASVLGQSLPAHALAPRPLTGTDFLDYGFYTGFAGELIINGEHYKDGVGCHVFPGNTEGASLNAHALVGYNAVVFKAGFQEGSGGGSAELRISRDNRLYRTVILRNGFPAQTIQILFAGAGTIELALVVGAEEHLALAEPTAILATGRGVALALGATSVQPGALLPISVTTAPSAPVALIIAYPDGTELAVGPTPASARGKFSYALRVPPTVHGTVRVVAVTDKVVAQATFTVG